MYITHTISDGPEIINQLACLLTAVIRKNLNPHSHTIITKYVHFVTLVRNSAHFNLHEDRDY
jgi:hypothetical protein